MATSINSILNMGNQALSNSQIGISVTGNNIANVNTTGYSRQTVLFEEYPSLSYSPGQIGQGAKAAEIMRHFNKFVEKNYLSNSSTQSNWYAQYAQLTSVESVFNESSGVGIGSMIQDFLNSWSTLSQDASSTAAREALLNNAESLIYAINYANTSLSEAADRATSEIVEQVAQANSLMDQIAALNNEINVIANAGSNPNSLLDARDQLVRELATIIDVSVVDNGYGDYVVNTKAGQTLVDGNTTFALVYSGPTSYASTANTSSANIEFSGTDGYEYTFQVVSTDTANGTATVKVSLDGGKTWLTGEDGKTLEYIVPTDGSTVTIKGLEISFDSMPDVDDKYTVVPKDGLYWDSPTKGLMNITPQQYTDGTYNSSRVTGGALAGNFIFRDYQVTEFRDQLDMVASALIWEVNRLHSQGGGITAYSSVEGDYSVSNTTAALGSILSGLDWYDKLQSGNISFTIYDSEGNPVNLDSSGVGSSNLLDFNFDPEKDSLQDFVDNINAKLAATTFKDASGNTVSAGDLFEAGITADGRFTLSPKTTDGYTFAVADDTTGLMAALGVNCFFKGSDAGTISLSSTVSGDINKINAGRVNGDGEINSGDADIAKAIANLTETKITFTDWKGKVITSTVGEYYSTLVANVGAKTNTAYTQYTSTSLVVSELADAQSEVSGVSLDEEMTNLIKYQSSYKAAAKLITTADQMLQTLLSLKQ